MTFVCVSAFTLTSERGTPCHLTKALAKLVPTIYINPPHSYFRWRELAERTDQRWDETDMVVLTPVLPTTFRFLPRNLRRKVVATLAVPLVLKKLEGFIRRPLVLWSYLGELTLPLHRALQAELLCYHRLDDYSVLLPKDRPLERAIEAKADLLFVVSVTLQEQYAQQGRQSILLPNAADIAHFSQALSPETPIAADLLPIPSPRIGFIGTIDPLWVDTDLLIAIAEAHPDWSVVIIGPPNNWSPPPQLPPNLHLLGHRPYASLPRYLKGLDVCLVPFKDNKVSHAASPLKLYEYLAAGRAVVSAPVPDLMVLSSVVWCAQGLAEFSEAIAEALRVAHDPDAQRQRLTVAAQHSWDARAQTALSIVSEAIKNRASQSLRRTETSK